MDLELTGKVAIVTGGSDGIGKAAAASMAREGAKVAIVGRTQLKLDAAITEIKVSRPTYRSNPTSRRWWLKSSTSSAGSTSS